MPDRRIILATQSPRRIEIMRIAGFEFEVHSKNVAETHPRGMDIREIPVYLASKKAKAFSEETDDYTLVIGADTIVILNNQIYEKPSDRDNAIEMLRALSGQMHEVITGVCIYSNRKEYCFSETTRVFFNKLSEEEIAYYVDQYKPFDKAGSYACQEWIGAVGINRFEGDYYNVVGLPINRLYRELKAF